MTVTPFRFPPAPAKPGDPVTAAPFQRLAGPTPADAAWVPNPWGGSAALRLAIQATDNTDAYGKSGPRIELQDTHALTDGGRLAVAWCVGFGDGVTGDRFEPDDQFTVMGQYHYLEPPAMSGSPLFAVFARSFNGDDALRFLVRQHPANPFGQELLLADHVPRGQLCFFVFELKVGVEVRLWWRAGSPPDLTAAPLAVPIDPVPTGGGFFGPLIGIYRGHGGAPSTVIYLPRPLGFGNNAGEAVNAAGWASTTPAPSPTNAQLRDQAVAELKQTTVGYINGKWKTPPAGTHWANALDLLGRIT